MTQNRLAVDFLAAEKVLKRKFKFVFIFLPNMKILQADEEPEKGLVRTEGDSSPAGKFSYLYEKKMP